MPGSTLRPAPLVTARAARHLHDAPAPQPASVDVAADIYNGQPAPAGMFDWMVRAGQWAGGLQLPAPLRAGTKKAQPHDFSQASPASPTCRST